MATKKGAGPDLTTIGGRIRYARMLRGLTLEQLAERAGTYASTLSRYEGNERDLPRVDILGNVARETGTTMEWLLAGKGDAPVGPAAPVQAVG